MNEYKLYANFKHQFLIGLILFSVCLFIGSTMILYNLKSSFHIGVGVINLIFASFIGYYTFKKLSKREPELLINELGVWIRGMDKLYPWAIIGRIEFKQYESEKEIFYKNYLQIQLFDEHNQLSIPYDDLDLSKESIIEILKNFKDANDILD